MIEFLEANWLTLALMAALAAFFLLLRNRTTKVDSTGEILKQDTPVIVEVFSNT